MDRSKAQTNPPGIDVRAHLAAIVDSSDDAILSKDLNGTLLSWNKGAERLYGYRADEIVGESVSMLVPDDRPGEVADILARLRAGEVVDHFETVRVRKDASRVPVSLTISPIRDSQGRVVAASTIARDITERRRAAEQAERFAGILAAANDAFVGMDADGIVTEWNRAAEKLMGWAADEVIGRRLSDTIIPHRYREAHERGLRRYLRTGAGPVIGRRIELAALHRDGHEIPIELAVFVTVVGGVQAFNAFLHDVSEHKRLTSELEKTRDQAMEASRLKSEFLATMSHEIRTPMNGVIGMTGLLLDTDLDPIQREYAETVRSSAEALLAIVNDILDFSKVEAGRLELEIVGFDLRNLVEDVADLLAGGAHAKGLELATLMGPNLDTAVRGDPGRLRQVLLNLVGNAIKFTDAGEVVVRVDAVDRSDDAVFVRFEVADTGIGIDPAALSELFAPFSQADSSATRSRGGTGLGLAISKRLVELMGGSLDVQSAVGHGSAFSFILRLARQAEPSVSPPARYDLAGLRVLVVDDNATNRTILENQVSSWGMEVATADTGLAGLERLRDAAATDRPYDLALLDMDMPGMNGLEVAQTVRGDPRLASLPLVLLTSSGMRGSAEEARAAGVSAYLTKPVRHSQLYDVIASVMGAGHVEARLVTQHTVSDAKAGARPRLLVVEDNVVNQKVAVGMLAKLGYRADVAANGIEAVDAIERRDYGAVLMDCQMPEMDGYAATAVIRARERDGDRVPIIAMTAAALKGERDRCLAAGMDDYLTKPVDLDDLKTALARWLKPSDDAQAETPSRLADTGTVDDTFDPQTVAALRTLTIEGQDDGFRYLTGLFTTEAASQIDALHHAVAIGDTDPARRLAHTLKGAAASIGARRVADACQELEQCLESEPATAAAGLARVQAEFDRVRAWLGSGQNSESS